MLTLELCGKLAELQGAFVKVTVPSDGCSVADLFLLSARQHSPLATGRIKVCVNEAVVAPILCVLPDDEVALFPPVSGG
ncbi:MoaD/ThiS family protein [Erythrobacter mangrovi]|uniref:MoaD/ThiS family protein n=1 Tax=Erythrobacter mangrovi TaxID=2739433 RepID=A0A7D3Y0Z2_9SPHN|nr:MoaD/ThiS family protein [Erythrobacter mangrovi]QKG72172.1 MoaD/ThiS family protein [Erythrobacter mangrovi]